jgi:translation initiation factor 2B subunit (eIF-2B alpha/beta/delta family)
MSYRANAESDPRLRAIAEDRVHGAGWLARRALGVLASSPPADWPALVARIERLRPEMPALAAAARDALACGDVRAVLRRADAERRHVAAEAADLLRGREAVATISNSSLVARALVLLRPPLVEVVVDGWHDPGVPVKSRGPTLLSPPGVPGSADFTGWDEGHLLLAELAATGVTARAVTRPAATVAIVGCDAVFADGGFVNRRGTARLVAELPEVLVLAERWKRVGGPTPAAWPAPDLFEVVRPSPSVRFVGQ